MRLKSTILFLLVGFVSGEFNTENCGDTKTCWRNKPGCSLSQSDCLFFSFSWNATTSNFLMEMSGGRGNGEEYSGIAFSPNGSMINSDVYFCTGNRFISGVIRGRSRPILDDELPEGVANATSATTNGVAECTFRREANVRKQISGEVQRDFNLINQNFFLLQAFGPYTESDSSVSYHNTNRWPSSRALNFSLVAITQTTTQTTPQTTPPPTQDCDTATKRCFRNPSGCAPLSTAPCMFASWSYNNQSRSFDFEMIGGRSGTENQYLAMAFGTVNRMEDADLYYCSNSRLTSAVIRERRTRPTVLNEMTGVSRISTGLDNGFLRCSFTRTSNVSKVVSNEQNINFDLSNNRYYLLMAIGVLSDDRLLTRHNPSSNARIITDTTMNFTMFPESAANFLEFSLKTSLGLPVLIFFVFNME